ncbi:protein FAR-RED ELONGATED HYPOCOTYL 3-like [Lotus japonicus]|uniref:protein FAR-RED ELONGATED HYPOCOTYL 3-like n=1 Tax=Lotus japonicus TaxID=34305 RepID=UPI002586AC45|nr:protein FAR-RED ELONGATED HYPOCOTYL 3-like [Lotus japonicus]
MKEKWAYCHMKKTFSLGMRSTQISESVNVEIKGFTNVNLDIIKFFKRFEDVVEEKWYNELKCEYEARQKIPKLKNIYSNILKQVSELYTPTIFDIFQNEYELFEACCVKSMDNKSSQFDCVIAMEEDLGEWKVSYDSDKKSISCSCRKFETFGILCCHCIRVFIHLGVKSMPEQYILKRWTKLARSGTSPNVVLSNIVEDERLSTRLLNKVIELENNNDGSTHVRGFKKREGKRRSRRLRSWVERQLVKRKKIDNSNASQSQEPTTNDDGKRGKMSMKGKGQQQVTKKRRGDNSSATQSQEPTKNDVGKKGMKKKGQQQITKKRRGDNSSVAQSQETTMQTQFHY